MISEKTRFLTLRIKAKETGFLPSNWAVTKDLGKNPGGWAKRRTDYPCV